MGELSDRRAQKKAQTRAHVRAIAHRMFAERGFDAVTIADVAREADVAVQTVFNHFATKEELFFDGRTPWVTGPADAVRGRTPGTDPLVALRDYLVDLVRRRFGAMSARENREYHAAIEASSTLLARERDLVHDSELRLAGALREEWTADTTWAPGDPATAATLTAATWLATVRALIVNNRSRVREGVCPQEIADTLGTLAEELFDAVMATLPEMQQRVGGVALPSTPTLGRRAG
ncbi:hypothetical protein DQ237_10500 [Blastococcus sp. TF02-8]|uniref:TetR/AcrR family transcriptional regulator n=1 Tax=Blastococcus sp. TF02-8 TaxID=2250574 RepID=UPI000DEB0068|nr:TetR/AcrR family transcriptional regulator [Blastococcus sp. TF02-8]RBY96279.1 hypothetical protein DQ237_10500 [Blastococcus sp. TF02-8]